MLFNSIAFIFWFLPIIVFGFFAIARFNRAAALGWLLLGALFFYGYWNPKYITLLLASMVWNYSFGYLISECQIKKHVGKAKAVFITAIIVNLSVLAYYKYANFFLSQLDLLTSSHFTLNNIILPLGISFFTFTQIAFLVDVYQQKVKERNPLHYFLFVTYYPHLIAGPIIHHAEMMPQFTNKNTFQFNWQNFSVGTLIFAVGLAKKVLLADQLAPYADTIFKLSTEGKAITFADSWVGVLAYTFQLYFDFSGYSDMAIGLSKMLNILLPVNFNSPYKAANIINFWRQWHITLSRFLRDYLYIPLGGNRSGRIGRYRNLFLTMVLGGLWHGASWCFIFWGVLHGTYLIINHTWQHALKALGLQSLTTNKAYKLAGWALTFLVVTFAWIFFRADNMQAGGYLLVTMLGYHGIGALTLMGGALESSVLYYLSAAAFICFLLPNTQQIFYKFKPGLETYPGDITPIPYVSRFNWPKIIKPRMYGYLGGSYALSMLVMILFYSHGLDKKIFAHFPTKDRPTYIDMMSGDYRSNLLSNDIFLGKDKKIVFVGSSYMQLMSPYKFKIGDDTYKTGTIANSGNFLTNGFRAAIAVMNNTKVDTLIFGVSALGFGKIISDVKTAPTAADQCVGSLGDLGFGKSLASFKECVPVKLSAGEKVKLLLAPGDETFFQFHNFLNKLTSLVFNTVPENQRQALTEFDEHTLKELHHWYQSAKLQAKLKHTNPPVVDNGSDKDFHWRSRGVLESMNDNGEVYSAFKELKRVADAKGVKLIVYNTPTVSHKEAPHIYPKNFIESYQAKLALTMKRLGIQYFDYQNDFIWDAAYTSDFIHPASTARDYVQAKLIYNVFFKGDKHEARKISI